jgi:hypothetical protein
MFPTTVIEYGLVGALFAVYFGWIIDALLFR